MNRIQWLMLIIGGFVACLFPLQLSAVTFYVDKQHTSANDLNPGTEALPWKTIQQAANVLVAGDTVLVKAGIYLELYSGTPDTGVTALKPRNSGTAAKPIIYQAYPNHTVVLDQQNSGAGFFIQSRNYITIRGFEIRNVYRLGGIWTLDDTKGITIENNEIHHVDGPAGSNVGGVKLDACDYCVVRNNIIHDITVAGVNTVFRNGANSAGVHSFGMSNVLIENNEIYNAYNGVYHKKSAGITGALIQKNIIHDVTQGVWFSVQGTGSPAHINQQVTGNIFFNTAKGIVLDAYDAATINNGLKIWNNVFHVASVGIHFDAVENVKIYNNVFLGPMSKEAIRSAKTNSLKPSIISQIDNNAFFNVSRNSLNIWSDDAQIFYNLSAWQSSTGFDANSISSKPLFKDVSAINYKLQSASPLRASGVDGVDIGAYPLGDETIGVIKESAQALTNSQVMSVLKIILLNSYPQE